MRRMVGILTLRLPMRSTLKWADHPNRRDLWVVSEALPGRVSAGALVAVPAARARSVVETGSLMNLRRERQPLRRILGHRCRLASGPENERRVLNCRLCSNMALSLA